MHFGFAFTVKGNLITEIFMNKKNFNLAFTMAEILLSLTIIGVVAAITLPSLTGNINERTWNTQKKALYARMSQAIALMGNLNGYGIEATEAQTNSVAAKVFITDGLSKVLKINNVCDSEHLSDCGIASKITTMGTTTSKIDVPKTLYQLNNKAISAADYDVNTVGYNIASGYSLPNTQAAAFETANGESVIVYYQPLCKPYMLQDSQKLFYVVPNVCANFVFDLNGKKGPNKVGKDIGYITALYATDSVVVAPMPLQTDAKNPEDGSNTIPRNRQELAFTACKKQDEDAKLPNIEEVSALFYNKKLANLINSISSGSVMMYWTAKNGYKFSEYKGIVGSANFGAGYHVRCVQR